MLKLPLHGGACWKRVPAVTLCPLASGTLEIEKPMNFHHVLALSCLGFGLCTVACGANNGKLFDEVLAPAGDDPGTQDVSGSSSNDGSGSPVVTPPEEEAPPGDLGSELGSEQPLPVRRDPPAPPEEPTPEPEPTPSAPTVVSVSPADGASGVEGDTPIVIRFSEPMDRASTEAAYQSEGAPSTAVTFSWSDDSTELTVNLDAPLDYSSGSDPALVEARRINYFVSASAAASDGRTLAQPYEFSFSLLRQIAVSVFAVQDRAFSGNFRSDDSYGAGNCAEDAINMCVGDVRVARQNEQYKGFISFELSNFPASITALSATLSLEVTAMSGNPFGGLGPLLLEHARFEAIGLDAFDADPLQVLGPIATDADPGAQLSADVSSAVLEDLGSSAGSDLALSQYRLGFQDVTDSDATSDAILSAWDTQILDITYLIP
jgi:Big-like domain-containing protein